MQATFDYTGWTSMEGNKPGDAGPKLSKLYVVDGI